MMKTNLRHVIWLYVSGFMVCAASLLLTLYWTQGGITAPGMVRTVVGGLPWIAVAGMIVVWRSRELPRSYPLAFVLGIGTPFLLLVIRGLL